MGRSTNRAIGEMECIWSQSLGQEIPRRIMIGIRAHLRLVDVHLTSAQQAIIVEEIRDSRLEAVAVLRVVAGFRCFGVLRPPRLPMMCPMHDRCQEPSEQEDDQQHRSALSADIVARSMHDGAARGCIARL